MPGNSSNNKLWEGHRMILPEMRKQAVGKCRDCRFFVQIMGRKEKRWGCIAKIKKYSSQDHSIPGVIGALAVIKLVGTEGLQEALERGTREKKACEFFRRR